MKWKKLGKELIKILDFLLAVLILLSPTAPLILAVATKIEHKERKREHYNFG